MKKRFNSLITLMPATLFAAALNVQAEQVVFSQPISFTVDPDLHLQSNGTNVSNTTVIPFTFTVQGPAVTGTLYSINISIDHFSQATIQQTGSNSDWAGYTVYQNIESSLGFVGIHDPWNSNDAVGGTATFTKTYQETIGSSRQYYNGPDAPNNVLLTGNESWVYNGTITTTGSITISGSSVSTNFAALMDFSNVVFSGTATFSVIDPVPVNAVPLPTTFSLLATPLLGLGFTGLRRHLRR